MSFGFQRDKIRIRKTLVADTPNTLATCLIPVQDGHQFISRLVRIGSLKWRFDSSGPGRAFEMISTSEFDTTVVETTGVIPSDDTQDVFP